MADVVTEIGGVPVLVCDDEGAPISAAQDALDIIATTFYPADAVPAAGIVAVPVVRFDERFFSLRTGLAGEILQKFVNYRKRLAVVGDISAYVAASTALRDLVVESNRGDQIWFVADLAELADRLRGVQVMRTPGRAPASGPGT